jgi:hypothetical protein
MAATPRPQAVTLACVFVGFSAFVLLLQLIQALTEWGTIEMQDGLQPTLDELRERGFDVTMGELLGTLRWAGLVGVLVLVAAIVFAFYAARGDQVSRIGITVLGVVAGLLVIPLGWSGLLLAMVLIGAATMLWSTDARRWYAAQHASAGAETTDTDPEPAANPWAAPAQSEPAAEEPTPPVRSTHRPRAVLAAGLVTVIGSALVGGLSGLYLVIYGFARDEYITLMQEGPFADLYSAAELDDALRAAFWACLVMLPLAAAGLAAGLSLLARLPIGRAATLALAWITAAAGVLMIPFGLLGTGAAVAVIVLLNRDESRAWTAGAR